MLFRSHHRYCVVSRALSHTHTHTTSPQLPRGARGQLLLQALTWCPIGHTLPTRKPTTCLSPPLITQEGERETGCQSPRMSPESPSSPTTAEGLGSPTTPVWHPASCSPPGTPTGTLPSTLPRSGLGGQRDLPGPPSCQPPVLRLTCPLPARQLSGWDLRAHLPHGPVLGK